MRNVITLGSPLQMTQGDPAASGLADRLQQLFDPAFIEMADHERGPLPVPSTSVYTRTDGVVRWQVCLDIADETHENVEVRGSHTGLGFNPAVLYVVADRLGQPEGTWRPFQPPCRCGRCTRGRRAGTPCERCRPSATGPERRRLCHLNRPHGSIGVTQAA